MQCELEILNYCHGLSPATARFVACLRSGGPPPQFQARGRGIARHPGRHQPADQGLEDYLGVRLFIRLTRALAITPQGEAMLPASGLVSIAWPRRWAVPARPGRGLNVTAPPSFATRWLVPRLPDFAGSASGHPPAPVEQQRQRGPAGQRAACGWRCTRSRAADSELAIRYGTGHYPVSSSNACSRRDWVPVCSPRLANGERPLRSLHGPGPPRADPR